MTEKAVLVHNKCPGGEFYRGGNDFTATLGDYKVASDGLVKTSHGVSVNTDPMAVSKFIGKHNCHSMALRLGGSAMKIFFAKDTDLSEKESVEKSCRLDVLVEVEDKYYHPYITMVIRILQEIEDAIRNNEIYSNDTCQIIVKAVDKQSIIDAIVYHHQHGFFDKFVPIDLKKNLELYPTPYTDIANWVLVYDTNK